MHDARGTPGTAQSRCGPARRRGRSQRERGSGRGRQAFAYDRLVIATGSGPFVIPVPGPDLAGVMTFRDIADVDAMSPPPSGASGRW